MIVQPTESHRGLSRHGISACLGLHQEEFGSRAGQLSFANSSDYGFTIGLSGFCLDLIDFTAVYYGFHGIPLARLASCAPGHVHVGEILECP